MPFLGYGYFWVIKTTNMKIPFFILALFLHYLQANCQSTETLLVLNKSENTLSFLNPVTLETIGKTDTGEGPHEICVSDDGKTAFVANYGQQKPGNTLSIIDVSTRKEIKKADLGALFRPHGLVYKNGHVFGTAEGSRCVFRFNTESGKVDWIMGVGQSLSHMLALSPDGEKIYTADILSNSVSVLHFNTPPMPEFIKHIPVGPKPEAIEMTPDGSEVWVGQNDDGHVTIITTPNNEVKEKIAVGKMPIRIKFTPDGRHALLSDPPADEIIVIDTKTRKVVKRIAVTGAPVGIAISPDGKWAYVALTKSDEVAKINLGTFQKTVSGKTGQNPDGIALSIIKT